MNYQLQTVTIQCGIATLPDGRTVSLNDVQVALNAAFAATGERMYMRASDQVAILTGQEHTARGFVATLSTDPESIEPAWSHAHSTAAQMEGWDIFDTFGSDMGPWQLLHLDDTSDIQGGTKLEDDAEAWRLVLTGSSPHHASAREFIRVHNPIEYEWALREYHPLRDLNAKAFLGQPAGFTMGGFTVGHAAKMNGNSNEAMIVDVIGDESPLCVVLEYPEPQPVDCPQGGMSTRFQVPATKVSSTWCKSPTPQLD